MKKNVEHFRESISSKEGKNKKWDELGKQKDLKMDFWEWLDDMKKIWALEYLPFPERRFSLHWMTIPKISPIKN